MLVVATPPQAAPLTAPFQVVAEPSGTLLVADGGSGRIVRVDPRTGRRSVYAGGLGSANGVAYGPGGLYALTRTQVIRFRGGGGARVVVGRGLRDPIGLVVAADGSVYVSEQTLDRVVRFDGATGARTVVASTGLDQPLGLALAADGSLLVADSHHHRVVRVLEDGTLEPVLEGLALPVALAPGPGGAVYVVDHVRHDRRGKILLLRPDGTTGVVSAGKILAVAGVARDRRGRLFAISFLPPFVGRLDAAGRLVAI